ncbi:hypothetical protein CTI12_AA552640 [Artemisia annua]|uniref:Uncharacterized protein n=1 Tax=Artemisia annua TaxID=35608 RepID=A0A2U1KXW1_ARTAN|nr:hypothetical protein CTI12_AA552640 [Artemisia annua]
MAFHDFTNMIFSPDDFAHLKIPLEYILSATNNFDEENGIGTSGIGKSYKGQLSWSGELFDIDADRLNKDLEDREQRFWMEISILSNLKHKNVVSLVGFCDENDEKIIIYKYDNKRGSLHQYLSDPMLLTWVGRLEISVGLANALSYIHYDELRDFSVIHRKIASGNVLLNESWEPKLYYFDISIKIKASQRHHSFHTSKPEYVFGYGDPTYIETNIVNHKSDIYSFGVVLLELLCGRISIIDNRGDNQLVSLAISLYREKKLISIIDKELLKQMDLHSFNMFADIACECLDEERSRRPNIDDILPRLEKALELQLKPQNYLKVHRYEIGASLNNYLSDSMRLTWVRRLEISVGLANALSYIHYDELRDFSVIHRKIANVIVLLNDNWEPKLSGFERSMKIKASQRHHSFHTNKVWGVKGYIDPTYIETKSVNHKSDMYSFGIVLFELLLGYRNERLAPLAINLYREKKLINMIDPQLLKQMDSHSFNMFADIAYECLDNERSRRPNIDDIVPRLENALELQLKPQNYDNNSIVEGTSSSSIEKKFQHLKIELQAIKSATNEFDDSHCIGKGGFGEVYKGELVHSKGQSVVALKRLNRTFGQGDIEFWKEIIMLSSYRHNNIVSLLGFCDDCGEKILVYEYASRKSLDLYLNNKDLTWVQRLEICIGAARGLAYLHNPGQTQQRVLHRDIKSSNILLDENWNARIGDLGLSKFGPANQLYTFLFSNAVGTIGYVDPLYAETGLLTKESDVYSFGVVLFEMLCGRLCFDSNHDKCQPLIGLVRKCYQQKTIEDIIFGNIKDEINPHSLKAFTTIAYECLNLQAQRPSMTVVVKELESALKLQEKDTDVEKVNREEKVERRGNAKGVNEEDFVKVRNRKNHGRGNYFQQKKQMFRPKETQNKGKDNGKNIGQFNMENGKGKENEIVQNSGIEGTSGNTSPPSLENKVDHDSKLVVDCFIINIKKPLAEEFQKWSQEMVQYFKSAVHRDGDYHRAVHVWIFAESTQQLLLQKRADCKDSWPGLWDISSAGHVSAGDTSLITARRELQEELGVTLPNDAFELLFVFLQECVTNDGKFIDNEFDDVYLVTTLDPIPLEAFTLQESEVSAVKYISVEEYKHLLANGDPHYLE